MARLPAKRQARIVSRVSRPSGRTIIIRIRMIAVYDQALGVFEIEEAVKEIV
jgi:hypothetical protein